jgi:phosphatidylserine decarboxylase
MSDQRDTSVPDEHHVHRVCVPVIYPGKHLTLCQTGHWLSQDRRHHHKFLNDTIEHVDAHPAPLQPVLQEFKQLVDKSTRLTMLFASMFDQVRMFVW